jgi:hypothetical protein
MLQGGKFVQGEMPDELELDRVVEKVFETYPKTHCPKAFFGPQHQVTPAMVEKALDQVKREASPGMPLGVAFKTKGDLIDNQKAFLITCVIQRLDLLQKADLTVDLMEDPAYLVRMGLTDPVRMFVKNEPHSLKKLSEGRLRLVASVSIIDEVIERLLCSVQNDAEIAEWVTCPSKPGIGLSLDEQTKVIYDELEPLLGNAEEMDVTGWDWSVKWWMLNLDVRCRIRLARAPPTSSFAKILHARMWCMARSLFISSDGKCFKQTVPGIMKSGSYLTSSTNSKMRVLLAYLAGAEWAVALGDDSVEDHAEGNLAIYERFGIPIKHSRPCGLNSFEFCSHRFVDGVAIPLNWDKGLFRLFSARPEIERAMQFVEEFRHAPELELCINAISRIWKLPRSMFT